MNIKDYAEQRQKLMDEARAALNSGDLALAKEKREAIEALDAEKEKHDKEVANLNALLAMEVRAPLNLEEKSAEPKGGVPGEKTGGAPRDEETLYRNAFARTLMNQPLNSEEAAVFARVNSGVEVHGALQTAATHTVVIPNTLVQQIWKEMGEAHPILRAVPRTYVKGKITYPREKDGGDNATWYDESTDVTSGSFTLDSIELDGYELAKSILISWKLEKMSIDAFLTYIANLIAEKMGNALAAAIVSGTGSSQPQGIVTALEAESSTPQVLTWTASTDEVDYAKLTEFMGLIRSGYASGAAIYAKNSFIWNVLANLLDETGRPYFITDVISGGVGRLFGHIVYEEDAIPDDAMLMVNVQRGYKMNVQEEISLLRDEYMTKRQTEFMGYAILDGKPITTKAFVYLKKSE